MRGALCTAFVLLGAACGAHEPGVAAPPDAVPVSVDAAPDAPTGPYPIILAHGLFGFDQIGPLEYFYGIPEALEAQGRQVFTPRVDAVQSAEVRGAQLVAAIEQVRAQTGAAKVVVIGHSQGGLDARWAAAHDPGAVAAVVTVATPHRGSPVADVASGLMPGDASAALDALADLFGAATAGSQSSFAGAISSLTSAGTAQFNAEVPDVPGVAYYSIAGRSALAGKDACPPGAAPFITTWDNDVDPMDAELLPIAGILEAAVLPGAPTQDGLVTVDSAKWGTFLGCIPADHFNEVCQIAGASPGLGNGFDCTAFWTGLESWLRAQGY